MNAMVIGGKQIAALGGIVVLILAIFIFKLGTTKPKSKNEIVYATKGIVTEWGVEGKSAFIHHEKIEGFMEEMTMLLNVVDTNEFSGVRLGDQLKFDLVLNQEKGTHIRNLEKTGRNYPEKITKAENSLGIKLTGSEINVGDQIPDFTLTDSNGQSWSSSRLKGKVWAMTFIFTRCPIPEFCPLMSKNFRSVSEMIDANSGSTNDWALVSITMDPEFDTPEVLENYAKLQGISGENWTFLTGQESEIKKIGDPLGLDFATTEFPITHNLRTAVIGPDGKLFKLFAGNFWKPEDLFSAMNQASQ